MRTATCTLLLLLAVASALADGLKAGIPGERSAAAGLVEQLGDRHFRTREQAGKQLLALGERAIPALEAGVQSPVPEIATRCESLLRAVRRAAEADALLDPTWIALPREKRTVQEIFDAVEKQSRFRLSVEGDQSVLAEPLTIGGERMPFWKAVDVVCTAMKLEVKEVRGEPGVRASASPRDRDRPQPPVGSVTLQAQSTVLRTAVHKAVLVQISPASKDDLARHSPALIPVVVRVLPEPRLKWEQVTEVMLVSASAPDGRLISPGIGSPPALNDFDERLLQQRGMRVRKIPAIAPDGSAHRGVLTLSNTPDGPTELDTLRGLVRFGVWKEQAEVATVRLAADDREGSATGPHGTQLEVRVIGPIANKPGETLVEITHRWDRDRVRVDPPGPDGVSGVWFENRGGKLVPVTDAPAEQNRPVPNQWGIVGVDSSGEQLLMAPTGSRIDSVRLGDRTLTTMTSKYIVRKDRSLDGKLTAVSFQAARVVRLSVPFEVKNLPLVAGTADATTAPTEPKR